MVATSLPFWMPTSRVMSPFADSTALRADVGALDMRRDAPPSRLAGTAVQYCDAPAMPEHEGAWAALAARALEPNVFLEPGFALPALNHFPHNQRPGFVLVWATEADRTTLIGLCAVRPLVATLGPRVSKAWSHEQATLSAPLLDRDRAGEALDLMLDWLARRTADWRGLVLAGVAADGALMRLLADPRRRVVEIERRERVVTRRDDREPSAPRGGRRAKELRRQRRRLGDGGDFVYRSAITLDDVRAATERFLDLEARGWKGGRGTALLKDAGLAAFTRAMTRRLARDGLCRIDSLEIDGQPVAMGIVLRSGDRAFFWKTCFDEARRRHSPGKQLADLLGQAQRGDPTLAFTDSCAVPGHPMIGQVWTDRMSVVDLVVAGPAVDPRRLARAAGLIGAWRRGREAAKALRDAVRAGLSRLV